MPIPKFKVGDCVRLVSNDGGYHHTDRIGQMCEIMDIVPDPIPLPGHGSEHEYATSFGFGLIRESRLALESMVMKSGS